MSTTRTSLLVLSLLAGVAYSVDSYLETRRPIDAAPHLAERAPTAPADAGDHAGPELHALELYSGAPVDPNTQA